MIVVDASAVLEVLLRTRRAGKVESLIFEPGVSLNAPHLLDLEVAQVLRRYALAGELDSARAEEALADLRDLPLDRFPHDLFSTRIWALRGNLSAYDAAYVSLAEALGAPLVTTDRRLARACRVIGPRSSWCDVEGRAPTALTTGYRGARRSRAAPGRAGAAIHYDRHPVQAHPGPRHRSGGHAGAGARLPRPRGPRQAHRRHLPS